MRIITAGGDVTILENHVPAPGVRRELLNLTVDAAWGKVTVIQNLDGSLSVFVRQAEDSEGCVSPVKHNTYGDGVHGLFVHPIT